MIEEIKSVVSIEKKILFTLFSLTQGYEMNM